LLGPPQKVLIFRLEDVAISKLFFMGKFRCGNFITNYVKNAKPKNAKVQVIVLAVVL